MSWWQGASNRKAFHDGHMDIFWKYTMTVRQGFQKDFKQVAKAREQAEKETTCATSASYQGGPGASPWKNFEIWASQGKNLSLGQKFEYLNRTKTSLNFEYFGGNFQRKVGSEFT